MSLLFLCLIHPIPLVASISFLNSNKHLKNSTGLIRKKSRTVRRCDSSPVHTAIKEFLKMGLQPEHLNFATCLLSIHFLQNLQIH
ncbi:hypothetical protein C7460_12332 [Marinoscillum furvescens DSM 4134]|uniref:Secreted protein n=1 Tax=Marinoscillum furvescens DSM 4134 TaxID=1122208 RepID=A0A3D9KZL5_MARFU|nr:hypothetical protein C7460_12332 [Marinoscillum furvescens DSM 4134]